MRTTFGPAYGEPDRVYGVGATRALRWTGRGILVLISNGAVLRLGLVAPG